jgi:cytosine/adenosine deaminase-related metal-dependent hydrolase
MPGLINAHSHGRGITTFQKGQKDEPLEPRLVESAHRGYAWKAESDQYWDTLYSCIKQIASGITTTVHSNPYYSESFLPYAATTRRVIEAYRDSGIRCAFALGIRDRYNYAYLDDPEFLKTLPDDVRKSTINVRPKSTLSFQDYLELLKTLASETTNISFQLGPTNPIWCTDKLLENIAEASNLYGWRIHTHLLETQYQAEFARRAYGKSWIKRLKDLGLLTRILSCAHCVWIDLSDLDLLEESQVQIVYNPSSNLRLCSGIAPIRALLARGIPVAFGMDSLSMNDDEDIFQDLRLGEQLQNIPDINTKPLNARLFFEMATLGGASVAGINNIGSLKIGNFADLILLWLPEIENAPMAKIFPLQNILLRLAKGAHVRTVMIAGKLILKDGEWISLNPEEIIKRLVASLRGVEPKTEDLLSNLKKAVRRIYTVTQENNATDYTFNNYSSRETKK